MVASLIHEKVHVLSFYCLLYDRHDIVFLWKFIKWILIPFDLLFGQVEAVEHRHKYNLITRYVLQTLRINILHERAPVLHSQISHEVLLFAEHGHVVVQVFVGLGGDCRVDFDELLKSLKLLILRYHNIRRLCRSSLNHSFEALSEIDFKLLNVLRFDAFYEGINFFPFG